MVITKVLVMVIKTSGGGSKSDIHTSPPYIPSSGCGGGTLTYIPAHLSPSTHTHTHPAHPHTLPTLTLSTPPPPHTHTHQSQSTR